MSTLDFPKQNINFLLDSGGLGDHICNLVAMRYIKDHFPWITPYLYVPDYFLDFARNLIPDMIIRPFSKGEKLFNKTWPGRQTAMKGHDNLSTHLVDYGFHSLANRQVPIEDKNYLKLNLDKIKIDKFNLPKDYVVITTGFTAPIREFKAEKVNAIVRYLNDKQVTPVFLGSHQAFTGYKDAKIEGKFNEEIDYSKGMNLVNKTNLLEAGKIIAGSKAIVGVDNGLLHVAGCTDVPIIGGYTSVAPEIRLPYRKNELGWNCFAVEPPDSEIEKYCQSKWDFVYDHDYRESYLKNDNLINSLPVAKFIEYLEKIL